MRVGRLIARRKRGEYVVYADVSGQGKKAVRVKIGYLADRNGIEEKVKAIRQAATLREAVSVVGGM